MTSRHIYDNQACAREKRFLPSFLPSVCSSVHPSVCPSVHPLVDSSTRSSPQALWNMAFAQEFIVLSAVLLCAIAACLTTAAIRLAPYKESGGVTVLSWEYWVLHFPLGLHAGWTSVGKSVGINCPYGVTYSAAVFVWHVYLLFFFFAILFLFLQGFYRVIFSSL